MHQIASFEPTFSKSSNFWGGTSPLRHLPVSRKRDGRRWRAILDFQKSGPPTLKIIPPPVYIAASFLRNAKERFHKSVCSPYSLGYKRVKITRGKKISLKTRLITINDKNPPQACNLSDVQRPRFSSPSLRLVFPRYKIIIIVFVSF